MRELVPSVVNRSAVIVSDDKRLNVSEAVTNRAISVPLWGLSSLQKERALLVPCVRRPCRRLPRPLHRHRQRLPPVEDDSSVELGTLEIPRLREPRAVVDPHHLPDIHDGRFLAQKQYHPRISDGPIAL